MIYLWQGNCHVILIRLWLSTTSENEVNWRHVTSLICRYWRLVLKAHTHLWYRNHLVWNFIIQLYGVIISGTSLSGHVRFVMPILLSDGKQCEALNVNVYIFCYSWIFRLMTDGSRFTISLQKKKTLIDRISPSNICCTDTSLCNSS